MDIKSLHAHNSGNLETARVDWSEFDDGFGNNISLGDQSMHRMVERGSRFPWETTVAGEEDYGTATAPKVLV